MLCLQYGRQTKTNNNKQNQSRTRNCHRPWLKFCFRAIDICMGGSNARRWFYGVFCGARTNSHLGWPSGQNKPKKLAAIIRPQGYLKPLRTTKFAHASLAKKQTQHAKSFNFSYMKNNMTQPLCRSCLPRGLSWV